MPTTSLSGMNILREWQRQRALRRRMKAGRQQYEQSAMLAARVRSNAKSHAHT